jgi:hypothetical protein
MGGNVSVSTNVATTITNNMVSVANNYLNTCKQRGSQIQTIYANCCTIDFEQGLNLQNADFVSTRCTQDASSKNDLITKVQASAAQSAQALAPILGFGDVSIATNITTQVVNQSESIVNDFFSTCINNSTQLSSITCANHGTITVGGNATFSNQITSLVDCMQKVSSIQSLRDSIKAQIDQTAVAKQSSIFSLVIAIIVVIIALVLFGGVGTYGAEALIVIVPLIVILLIFGVYYAATASTNGWYPYIVSS